MIPNKELNFSRISKLINYSSLPHLSNPFGIETRLGLTEYKTVKVKPGNFSDQII